MTAAVIFDCDGVLVDSEFLALEIELSFLKENGLEYELREYKRRFLGLSAQVYFLELAEDAKRRGLILPADLRSQMDKRYAAALAERLQVVPGIRFALDAVQKPIAVASSSTGHHLETKLRKAELWERFFPHIYCADHVEHAKPAPDLFLHAARQMDMPAELCLVIEDSVMGVRAARAAGMRVWGFVGGSHNDHHSDAFLTDAGAERIVANWAEASLLFREL